MGAPATTELVASRFGTQRFMDPTVRELPKEEEIVLPDIRFLTLGELDALRANAEALKKSSSKTRGRKRVDFPYSFETRPGHRGPTSRSIGSLNRNDEPQCLPFTVG